MNDNAYQEDTEAWRESLEKTLRGEDSWLALAGLYWLEEGENAIGADPENAIVLPGEGVPAEVGDFHFSEGTTELSVAEGVDVVVDGEAVKQATLQPDTSGNPSIIQLGSLTMVVIKRGQRFGVRLWDNLRPQRQSFPGRSWFPIRPHFVYRAAYQPYEEFVLLTLPSAAGEEQQVPAVGRVAFEIEGQSCQLDALEGPYEGLFLIFRDPTNGKQTYPAGRYLITNPPRGGEVVLDFNRAYNPPCAFTEYATCALPPPENLVPAPVEAGEKYLGDMTR